MIKATIGAYPFSSRYSIVVSDTLPLVGETIELEHYGKVEVAGLWHDRTGNYIEILFQDRCQRSHKFSAYFEVKEGKKA